MTGRVASNGDGFPEFEPVPLEVISSGPKTIAAATTLADRITLSVGAAQERTLGSRDRRFRPRQAFVLVRARRSAPLFIPPRIAAEPPYYALSERSEWSRSHSRLSRRVDQI